MKPVCRGTAASSKDRPGIWWHPHAGIQAASCGGGTSPIVKVTIATSTQILSCLWWGAVAFPDHGGIVSTCRDCAGKGWMVNGRRPKGAAVLKTWLILHQLVAMNLYPMRGEVDRPGWWHGLGIEYSGRSGGICWATRGLEASGSSVVETTGTSS